MGQWKSPSKTQGQWFSSNTKGITKAKVELKTQVVVTLIFMHQNKNILGRNLR